MYVHIHVCAEMRVLASATANISYEFLTANSVLVRRASDNPDRNLISPAQLHICLWYQECSCGSERPCFDRSHGINARRCAAAN